MPMQLGMQSLDAMPSRIGSVGMDAGDCWDEPSELCLILKTPRLDHRKPPSAPDDCNKRCIRISCVRDAATFYWASAWVRMEPVWQLHDESVPKMQFISPVRQQPEASHTTTGHSQPIPAVIDNLISLLARSAGCWTDVGWDALEGAAAGMQTVL